MNPILNQLMSSNPIVNLFKTVLGTQDQNAATQQMAQTNPQLKQTLDYISKNGGNAKALFYSMAQQKSRDPNPIIDFLKNI